MRPNRSDPKSLHRAAELRRALTPAEAKLWAELRGHQLRGIGFRRQHAIGHYIVDFCAPRSKLIIEVDGTHHAEQERYDAERTIFLEEQGYQVLRFWNREVINDLQGVLAAIARALDEIS